MKMDKTIPEFKNQDEEREFCENGPLKNQEKK